MSLRLEKVLSACRRARCLADIGTDHGLLPISSVLDGKAERAIACDLREAPLSRCRENIERFGVSGRVSARCAYGLDAIIPGEADEITIAGMGGMLMCEIIYKALRGGKLFPGAKLVLCPNTHDEFVRRMVYSACFSNVRESAVRDGGMIYLIVSCVYVGGTPEFDYAVSGFEAGEGFEPGQFTGHTGKLPKYYYRKVMEKAQKRVSGLEAGRHGKEYAVMADVVRKCEKIIFSLDT